MKSKNLIWLLALTLAPAVQAGTYTISSGTINAAIPDNNPNGYASSISATAPGADNGQISLVTVDLTISGGYNGDYYAYLVHTDPGNSTVAQSLLLNRVGTGTGTPGSAVYTFGYSNPGFNNVNIADGAAGNVHNAAGTAGVALSGSYAPDNTGGGAPLSNFIGQSSSSGSWTLFIADLSAGDQGTLVTWDVNITAVPEPVNVALGGFGVIALGAFAFRRFRTAATA